MTQPPDQTCLSRYHLRQSLVFDAPSNSLYLNNAKSGCSTIRAALIKAIAAREGIPVEEPLSGRTIHGNFDHWSLDFRAITPGETFCFSLVRNPFTRILSAYLDKIVRPGILRNQFYFQAGLDPETEIDFPGFLARLDPETQLFDQHWRPQVANLYAGRIAIDQVHYLETFDKTQDLLAARISPEVHFHARQQHGTGAADRLAKYLTPEATEIIQRLYHADFETFGYSTDPARVAEAPDTPLQLPGHDPAFFGCLAILGAQLSRSRPQLGAEAGYAELALANRWDPACDALAESGSPAERVIALGARGHLKPDVSPDQAIADAEALTRIAPYTIGTHKWLCEMLIARGRIDEARRVAERLGGLTWQKAMVDTLLRKLDAA